MDDRAHDADEARARARERLRARQGRIAAEEGRRPASRRANDRPADERSPFSSASRGSGSESPSEGRRSQRTWQGASDERSFEKRRSQRTWRGTSALGSAAETVRGFASTRTAKLGGAVVVGVIVLVALFFGISSLVKGCAADAPQESGQAQQEQSGETGEGALPAPVSLPEGLDSDLAASLEEAAATSEDVAWIANHAADYAVDGDMVQYKLLKLAVDEPEAVGFVRGFPESYPADSAEAFDGTVETGTVPHLYQWDERWGYTVYSSTTFALTGCCPTALSMVYMGLTGKADISPYDMGVRAESGGYMTQYNGTDGTFLVNEAPSLGLSCSEIGVSSDALTAALESGNVVICNVGPGDFTEGGHYFVITGLNDDGTVSVNDPYSAERSAKTWDVDQIIGQTKALYAYSVA